MPEGTVQPKIALPELDASSIANACRIIGEMFVGTRSVVDVANDSESGNSYATISILLQFQLTSALTQLHELREASEYAYKQMTAGGVFDAESWSASVTGLGDALAKFQPSPASAVKGE